jgi:hypothetical protein
MIHYTIFVILLLCTIYLTHYLDNNSENYYKDRINKYPKVYDVGHKYLPDFSHYEYVSNYYMVFFIVTVICLPIYKEFIGFMITILSLRLIIIHLTILPKNKYCDIDTQKIFGGCYDKIFSGHFSTIFLISLLLWKHKYISFLLLFVINIISVVLILITRSHYTIDIVVAFFITLFVYQNKLNILK